MMDDPTRGRRGSRRSGRGNWILPAAAALALLAVPCAAATAGDDGPPPVAADDRDVPPPPVPGLELPPPGLVPEAWKTWTAEQDVSPMNRISVGLSVLTGSPLPGAAGSGENAPGWGDVSSMGIGSRLEVRYNLMPALSACFAAMVVKTGDNTYDPDPDDDIPSYEFTAMVHFGGFLGVRLELPLATPWSRLLRTSRPEASRGISVSATLLAGFAHGTGMTVWWYESASTGSRDTDYFAESNQAAFSCAFAIEYRWVHVSAALEFGFTHLGVPAPSEDPVWAQSSKAGPLVFGGIGLSLSFHF